MNQENQRLMIVDALNIFLRAYIKDPSLSKNGNPVGGLKGFLRILQKQIRVIKPTEIIICWDGDGGSRKRKKIHKGYKEGRKPIRLNRGFADLNEHQELENKVWQQTRLFEYLNDLPVIQLMCDAVEADDIIAYVMKHKKYEEYQKVIVSSDKDFYQLCDEKTIIYRPSMKEDKTYMTKPRILEEFGIHPKNFALARAIEGDKSDNIDGVAGVGLKTVSKRFPFMVKEEDYSVQDLVEYSQENLKKSVVYEKIIADKEKILLNYNLMQLYSPTMGPSNCNKVRWQISNFEYDFAKTEVVKKLHFDGLGDVDFSGLFLYCRNVSRNNKILKK